MLNSAAQGVGNTSYSRLPTSIQPTHYTLHLFDLLYRDPWSFQGHVDIDLVVTSETKCLVLNMQELNVSAAEFVSRWGDKTFVLKPSEILYDTLNQRCIFWFDENLPLSPEHSSVLSITFQGTMNDQLIGFYRSGYRPRHSAAQEESEGGDSRFVMLSTQFQPTYARRAFPCFDEPNLKATFDFSIEVPCKLVALSNMAQRGQRSGKDKGLKVVEFERTPVMSPYLLAWAVGEFEYIEQTMSRPDHSKYPVRLYATEGLTQHGTFGLQMAVKALGLFSEMFHIDYPLSKLDLLAVHGMADDAMENWGLLTFQNTALLFDENTSDPEYLTHVAYIVAHEVAHQWFGNLVTMDWWNELWLNEGIATWAGWHVVDMCFPEWNVWAQFVGESMQEAFHLDSLRASHPVEVPVLDAVAVDSIFDVISYTKGSSLIRMLAMHIGVSTFLQGVSEYLQKFAYGNTTASHLWKALTAASGFDVEVAMRPWIMNIGFPVITVSEKESQQLLIQQNRYIWDEYESQEENATVWWVPILINSGSMNGLRNNTCKTLETRDAIYNDCEAVLHLLNAHQAGFYRTDWSRSLLKSLSDQTLALSTPEQIGLIGDVAASAATRQGTKTTADLLSLMQRFRSQRNVHVWNALFSHLNLIKSIFSCDEQVTCGLNNFVRNLTSDLMQQLEKSMTTLSPPTGMVARLRSIVLLANGLSGHTVVANQMLNALQSHLRNGTVAADPALRQTVLSVAVHHGDSPVFQLLKQEYSQTTLIDGKETILRAMGQVQTTKLAEEALDFAFGGNVETQELLYVIEGLAGNEKISIREVIWHFIKQHWVEIEQRYFGCLGTFEPLLRRSLETLASTELKEDVKSFFDRRNTTKYAQGLAVALESIAWRTDYRERDYSVIRTWLKVNAFIAD